MFLCMPLMDSCFSDGWNKKIETTCVDGLYFLSVIGCPVGSCYARTVCSFIIRFHLK